MVKKMRSSSVTGRVPEFFKIFFSLKKIPVEFLEQLTCEIHGIFSLLGPSGKVWRVRLLEMGDGCYFENGWQDSNWLQVQIFEQNGCEKESAFEANCNQESTTNCSPLPRPFCKEHLPDHSQDMTLRVPRGEVWGVRFYMNQTHQIGQLTVGWRKVSFTNNIEASDLHIFRVVEEITPLKRQRDI
ncbi:hypothetical protein MKW92_045866 [Papaver armeniacum]|nr:hypothetical protein MKW92_045866 [Papaver armeniacum]